MRRGATEDLVAKLADYEQSDLPARTKAALRYADRLTSDQRQIDRRHLAGPENVGEQEDGHEGGHDEIEMTERPLRYRRGLDRLYRSPVHMAHR